MEKITKEELKKLLSSVALSDEELEKISGGSPDSVNWSCFGDCVLEHPSHSTEEIAECWNRCS